jgi:hypothetical protein
VVAAAFLAAMLEIINDHIVKNNSQSAKDCLGCFVLDRLDEPHPSTRHTTFENIASRAETLLKEFEDQYNSSIRLPDTDPVDWYNVIYETLCKGPADTLAKTLLHLNHHRLVIGFDECTLLKQASTIYGRTTRSNMSTKAFQRIIKAADYFPTDGFAYWLVFLDTSSSVFKLIPPRKDAPSARFTGQLDPLPIWTFMGYDQMAPQPSSTPQEALEILRLRQYGRPVRGHQVSV